MKFLYKKLEDPRVYNFIIKIISFGRDKIGDYLLKHISPQKGQKILDVGCGTGKYIVFPDKYTGIDINDDYIKYARNNHKGKFITMDATDLEFPDQSFDYLYTVGVFHHMSDDHVKKAVEQMQRVCRKGGKILIIEPVFPSKINFIGYLLFKFDRGDYTRTLDHLGGILSDYGFKLQVDNIKGSFPYKIPVFSYEK